MNSFQPMDFGSHTAAFFKFLSNKIALSMTRRQRNLKLKSCTISQVHELSEHVNFICIHGDAFHGLTNMPMRKMRINKGLDNLAIPGSLRKKKMSLIKDKPSLRRPEISPENYFLSSSFEWSISRSPDLQFFGSSR